MAITLQKRKLRFSLGNVVQGRLAAFAKARQEIQVSEELEFYKQVNEKGLSLSEQLEFRKAQLEREQRRGVPDDTYLTSLKKEVSTLRRSVTFQRLREAYNSSLQDVIAGKSSFDAHLTMLNERLKTTTDPEMVKELQDEIFNTTKEIRQQEDTLLDNTITLAKQDKTIELLTKAIEDTKMVKAKALGAGDSKRAQAMDLKLSTLNQTLTEVKIKDKDNALDILKSRKASAVSYLQNITEHISRGDTSGPVVVDGVRYASEQDYFSQKRDKYISTNFFTDLEKEYGDYVDGIAATVGRIPETILAQMQGDFAQFGQRQELQPFLSRLETTRAGVLKKAADITATAITNRYAITNDYEGTIRELELLQSRYGIDQTTAIQRVVLDQAKTKGEQYQNIVSQIQAGVASGLTWGQASNQVFGEINKASGKITNANTSPQDLVSQTPEQLAAQEPQKTKEQTNAPAVPLPEANPNQPTAPQGQTPGIVAGASIDLSVGKRVSDFIGTRKSAIDPKVTEYFRKDTGVGFGDPVPLFSYLKDTGFTDLSDFNKLNKKLQDEAKKLSK